MEILNKYTNSKSISILGLITSGILSILGICLFFANEWIFSVAGLLNILLWISIIASISLLILCGNYLYKIKTSNIYLIIYTILNAIVFLFSMIKVRPIFSLLSNINKLNNDFMSGLMSLAGSYSDLESLSSSSMNTFMIILLILSIGSLVMSILLFINKINFNPTGKIKTYENVPILKIISKDGFEKTITIEESKNMDLTEYTVEEITVKKECEKEVDSQVQEPINFDFSKVKTFFKSKKGKLTLLICIGIIAICALVSFIYPKLTSTAINLSENIEVEFTGYDGDGELYVKNNNVEYDKSDSKIRSFVSSIYYDYSKSEDLKNGDKVTIYAIYDKDEAKELNLRITDDKKEIKVDGLKKVYKLPSDIPEEMLQSLQDKSLEVVNEYADRLIDKDKKVELVTSYFISDKEYNSNYYIVYYEVSGKDKKYFSEEYEDVSDVIRVKVSDLEDGKKIKDLYFSDIRLYKEKDQTTQDAINKDIKNFSDFENVNEIKK